MDIKLGTVSFCSSESLGYQYYTEEKLNTAITDLSRYISSIIVYPEEVSVSLSGSFQLSEDTEYGVLPSVLFNSDLSVDKILSKILFSGEDNVALYYCENTIPDIDEFYEDIKLLEINGAFNNFKSFTVLYERSSYSESFKRYIPIPKILYTTLQVKDVG